MSRRAGHAPGEARLRVTVRDAQGSPVPSFTEPVYLKLCHLPRGKGIKHLVCPSPTASLVGGAGGGTLDERLGGLAVEGIAEGDEEGTQPPLR